MKDSVQRYIGAEWVDGPAGDRIEVEDPATGDVFAQVARATTLDVDRAMAAPRDCVVERRLVGMSPADPGRLIVDMAGGPATRPARSARCSRRDQGTTLQESHWEIAGSRWRPTSAGWRRRP